MRSVMPGYPQVLAALDGGVVVATLDDLFGGAARVVAAQAAGLDLFAIDAPHLFARARAIRTADPTGSDWHDNPFRFAALSRVAQQLAQGLIAGYRPDVVHAHDWQAGLVPAYLHYGRRHRSADSDDDPQSRVPGAISGGLLRALGFRRMHSPSMVSNTTAASAF